MGRTDAAGRVVFLPDGHSDWRLRAFSDDGHGLDQHFEASAPAQPGTAPNDAAPDRTLAVLGGGLLLALFGLYQLFTKARR